VLGLHYFFYPLGKLTCEQFTCKVLKHSQGFPRTSAYKGKGGEVIQKDEGVGQGTALIGEGEAEQGDEMEEKVRYGK